MVKKKLILFIFVIIWSVIASANKSPLSDSYYQLGDLDKAVEACKALIKANPDDDVLYFNLGYIYFQKKEFPLAILNFERAIKINPRNQTATKNLKICHEKLGHNLILNKVSRIEERYKNLIFLLSSNMWLIFAFVSFIILFWSIWLKRILLGVFFGLLGLFMFMFSYQIYSYTKIKNKAIIISSKPQLYIDANLSTMSKLPIIAGQSCTILNSQQQICEIKIPNGVIGFVYLTDVEKL